MDSANERFSGFARWHKAANMNGRAIPREKFSQLWTEFFTSPLAMRQRPATEELLRNPILTFWRRNYISLILAHPVYKCE